MDKCLSAGTYVMYKDGEHWKEGVVDSNSAVGAMRIRSVNQICDDFTMMKASMIIKTCTLKGLSHDTFFLSLCPTIFLCVQLEEDWSF